jgi:hypothetical protein
MRFSTLATTLLVSVVSAQDAYPAGDTTMMSTWTLTKTVQRVVETVTATRNVSSSATASPPLGTASAGVYPQSNGTSTVLGTSAGFPGGVPTGLAESGADGVRLEMLGLMAVVGVVGLVGL